MAWYRSLMKVFGSMRLMGAYRQGQQERGAQLRAKVLRRGGGGGGRVWRRSAPS